MPPAEHAAAGPQPVLSMRHVVAICVGIVVGAGIFRTPALVAGASGSAATFLLTWVAGGLLSIVGALCYAELAAAWPHAGGDYHYLCRAYGRRLGFLYAWARLAVIQTGSLALLAFVFGDYVAPLLGLGSAGVAPCAAALVVSLTLLNWLGVRRGGEVQFWLTALEVGGLLLVGAVGLLAEPAAAATATAVGSGTSPGLVMVFVLLTFGGWNEAVFVTAELKDGPKRIARVLVTSLVIVTVLYFLANLAYLRVLGLDGVRASEAIAAELLDRTLGPAGAVLISLLVAVSALTSANATALTGARTTWALGRGFPALGWLGRWDGRRNAPGNALLAQGAIALLLVVAGAFARDGFTQVVEFTAPVFWFFFLLTGIAVFVLRVREPRAERPFRVPLYPVLPAVFCLTSAWLLYSSLAYTGAGAVVGVVVLAAGLLLLPFLRQGEDPRA